MSEKGDFSTKDVLTLKGAAAQQTTNPGNLAYYKFCEERFAEYSKLSVASEKSQRRAICLEIVKAVNASGGIFRRYNGKPMDDSSAIAKTMDRMRQIQKPKMAVPPSVGENDVVFKAGSTNHLFPGNAKWRALLDQYVERYWPEFFSTKEDQTRDKPPINRRKPKFQVTIANELIDVIHKRGGKFRGTTLRVLEKEDIVKKIHERFKDVKKLLVKGQRITPNQDYILKRTGCTSVKTTVQHGLENRIYEKKKKKSKTKSVKTMKNVDDINASDDDSFGSRILTDDESEESDGDSNIAYTSAKEGTKRIKREKQIESRNERVKRRAEILAQPANPHPRKKPHRRRSTQQRMDRLLPPQKPNHEMSEYEKLRYEKIQRNHERLTQLGLLERFSVEEEGIAI